MMESGPIYCTWSHRARFPNYLQSQFGDLDDFIRRLIMSADKNLTIVSPYLSASGLVLLTGALSICAERLVRVRLVTDLFGEPAKANRTAVDSLLGSLEGTPLRFRIRVLSAESDDLFIHAKMIVADSERGYIGSANISARGLDRNLEMGVHLSPSQCKSLDALIDFLESRGSLCSH